MIHRLSTRHVVIALVAVGAGFAACSSGSNDEGSSKQGLEALADEYCDKICDCDEDACPDSDDDDECAETLVKAIEEIEGDDDFVECQRKAFEDNIQCLIDKGSCERSDEGAGGGDSGGGDSDDGSEIGWYLADDGCFQELLDAFSACYAEGSGGGGGSSPGPGAATVASTAVAGPGPSVAASSGGGPTCGEANDSCSNTDCCPGNTCVSYADGTAYCSADCVVGDDCASGCCVGFADGEGFCIGADACTGGVCESDLTSSDPETDACLSGYCCAEAEDCTSNGADTEACLACLDDGGGTLCDDFLECASSAGCF